LILRETEQGEHTETIELEAFLSTRSGAGIYIAAPTYKLAIELLKGEKRYRVQKGG
jgi:hypothetical protein